jgi:hypothetical protein
MIYSIKRKFGGLREQRPIGSNMEILTQSISTTRQIKEKGRILFTLFKIHLAPLGRIVTRLILFLILIFKTFLTAVVISTIMIFSRWFKIEFPQMITPL